MKALRLLAIAALFPACQQAPLDGAWTGRLECDNSLFDVDAALDQSLETGQVTGAFFVEYLVDFGLLGQLRSWSKGRLDDAEFDAAEGIVAGRVVGIDEDDDNQAPDWKFALTLDDEPRELTGEFERLDSEANVVVTCAAELSPVADPGN